MRATSWNWKMMNKKNGFSKFSLLRHKNCVQPGSSGIHTFLDNDCLDAELSFSQWISTDRCNMEKYSEPLTEFLDYFIIKQKNLIPHCFISLTQSDLIKNKMLTLKPTEVLLSSDFAENYALIMLHVAHGFHWLQ